MTGMTLGASGFITSTSSLGADLSLLASVAAACLLTAGVLLVRRRRYGAHRATQTGAVILNAVPVVLWMMVSLGRDILPGLPGSLSEHGHLLAAVHAAVGAAGFALGIVLVVRGNQLMARGVSLRRYRNPMRLAYLLYLAGVVLGAGLYVVTYGEAREVLLVFPGRRGAPDPQVPLQLLHVAAALRKAGYRPRLADLRLGDYRRLPLGDPVFVGITAMSGPQIRYGLQFAGRVRAERPHTPIAWGGVHPTLLPEQTAADPRVDAVVRGEAELVVGPLADALAAGDALDGVAGLTFAVGAASKGGGPRTVDVRSTPDAPLIDLDDIPVELPYDLLPLGRYPTLQAGRVHLQTSRGCPSRCSFCYNTSFNQRRWRGKSPERVVDEMAWLLGRFPGAGILDPVDDNFFVDRRRVERICELILGRGLRFRWRANCRFDALARFDGEFLALLERAGCIELDFGGESGSAAMQDLVRKDVSADEILAGVANLRRYAPTIDPFVSWLSGLPGETWADMERTFDLMDALERANPRTQHYGIFLYTPFPSPLLDDLPAEFTPPESLEEWGGIEVFHFLPPWHAPEYVERLRGVSAVTRWAFYPRSRIDEHGVAFKMAYGTLCAAARLRWRRRAFDHPLELRLANAAAQRLRGFL